MDAQPAWSCLTILVEFRAAAWHALHPTTSVVLRATVIKKKSAGQKQTKLKTAQQGGGGDKKVLWLANVNVTATQEKLVQVLNSLPWPRGAINGDLVRTKNTNYAYIILDRASDASPERAHALASALHLHRFNPFTPPLV